MLWYREATAQRSNQLFSATLCGSRRGERELRDYEGALAAPSLFLVNLLADRSRICRKASPTPRPCDEFLPRLWSSGPAFNRLRDTTAALLCALL